MNSRWGVFIAAALVAFASFVITWQIRHYDDAQDFYSSVWLSLLRGQQLAAISDISKRDGQFNPASESNRHLDLMLPKDVRIFMTDMTGPANYNKIWYYFYATYYLFPREVGVSLDQPTRTKDGFPGQTTESDQEILTNRSVMMFDNVLLGRTTESDQEILSNGFDVRMDTLSDWSVAKELHQLSIRDPVNPDWFDSDFDLVIAFLLPLLTALAGMWLFRFLFSTLSEQMPLLEQLASSLGLGMMAVAALTLGVKLCGFHGQGLILIVTAVGTIAEIWRDRKVLLTKIADSCWKLVRSPITAIFVIIGLLVFLILFRIAGLQGLVDGDAVRWMLKAKIMHLYTGNELVQWFSNPRLAHAHLDYPTLVPSLHSATYDSLGHVDEFVTKFWPTWMLFFLMAALASLNRAKNNWRHVTSFALLGLLLLPATQKYVQWEGGTLPMIFFTVLGFVQCVFWLMRKDRARLGLGLTFLFGAAMAKFEGFIFLALVGSWILLLPSARPSLKLSPPFWRILAFWFLAALPFICLRIRIPVLHFESGWAGYALHSPGVTLSNWPGIVMIVLARLFLNPDFANWNGEDGQFHWIGKWDGLSSLYNHSTLGLAWLCLLLTVALWFTLPAQRRVIVWILAMLVGAMTVLGGVFASFVNITSLAQVMGYTSESTSGRFLLPVLLAWFATMMTMFFAEPPLAITADRSLPVLKHGYWLAVGAFLILVLGAFVLPKN